MGINEEFLIDYIGNNTDDEYHTFLLIRMYDEYCKYQEIEFKKKETVSLGMLISAVSSIGSALKDMTIEKVNYNDSKTMLRLLSYNALILKNYMTNFDIKDKNKLYTCISLITKLECLLKLPLTFPFYLEECINNEIENKNINLEEKKGDQNGKRNTR